MIQVKILLMVQKSSKPLSLVFLFSYHLQCSCIFSGGDRRISEPSAVWNMFFAHTSLMTKLGYASLSYHGQMFFRIQQTPRCRQHTFGQPIPNGLTCMGLPSQKKAPGLGLQIHHPPLAELASVPAKLFHPNVLRWKFQKASIFVGEKWWGER